MIFRFQLRKTEECSKVERTKYIKNKWNKKRLVLK